MPKNIVICLDGTGNQLKARGNTNVVLLYGMLQLGDPAKQVAYYDPGVGTFSSSAAWTPVARWLSKVFGLAFGSGLKANLAEAYSYLVRTYEPDDQIFIFGFSRGAYTARALCGMLDGFGILRPGCENLVPYAVSIYTRSKDRSDDDWAQQGKFAQLFAQTVAFPTRMPVHFVGIWDSVKAAGFLRWKLRWPYTRTLRNAKTVRHAISIDEKRYPYREYVVERPDKGPFPETDEAWFAGVHSDVGGTFDDDPTLPTIALKWMLDGAIPAGLILKRGAYKRAFDDLKADGRVHRMGWIWVFLGYRRRPIPKGARVHSSVRERADFTKKYEQRFAEGVTWVDPEWQTLHARPDDIS
ncbi:DUF2235 domain-containing protein [Mycolicibacterium sp. XJ870]